MAKKQSRRRSSPERRKSKGSTGKSTSAQRPQRPLKSRKQQRLEQSRGTWRLSDDAMQVIKLTRLDKLIPVEKNEKKARQRLLKG